MSRTRRPRAIAAGSALLRGRTRGERDDLRRFDRGRRSLHNDERARSAGEEPLGQVPDEQPPHSTPPPAAHHQRVDAQRGGNVEEHALGMASSWVDPVLGQRDSRAPSERSSWRASSCSPHRWPRMRSRGARTRVLCGCRKGRVGPAASGPQEIATVAEPGPSAAPAHRAAERHRTGDHSSPAGRG